MSLVSNLDLDNVPSVEYLLNLNVPRTSETYCDGFRSSGDGGEGVWKYNPAVATGTYSLVPVLVSGKPTLYSITGAAYQMVLEESIDLRQLGAVDGSEIDTVFAVAAGTVKANAATTRIVIYGKYLHRNPLVLPPNTFLDYVDYNYSSTTKITNNTSGLPTLTGSYGGDLVMDVDACIILDHGYGHRIDNFNIQVDAPVSVAHAIYHGFTRETNIAETIGRIGTSGNLKYRPMKGITAQQGFIHNYGYIMCYSQKGTWNYILNSAGTGCNAIRVRQAWNYGSTETAIKMQATTNVALGQQYCEGTSGRIYEFFGATGSVIDVLTVDQHVCNNTLSALFSRNSQLTLGAVTINSVSVQSGHNATFFEHRVGTGIYGCLTINGITVRTQQLNVPNLTTLVKDQGAPDGNCVVRGMPIPNIGALGNASQTDASIISHQVDTGITSTPHWRSVISSFGSQASGVRSAVINGFNSYASNEGSTVLSSTLTRSGASYEVSGGYGGTTTGTPLSSNRTWAITSTNGNIAAKGTITNGATFADFAEYFENAVPGAIPLGTLVSLTDEGKVIPASEGSEVIGVVSGTAGIVLNSASLSWQGMYELGDFGEPVWEDVVTEEGTVVQVRKLSKDYDEQAGEVYVPRSERPEEWTCVGLLGQVHVRVDSTVKPGMYVQAGAGAVGTASTERTNLRCMRLRSTGSGLVAYCLLK